MNRLEFDPALGFSFRIYLFMHGSFFTEKNLLNGLLASSSHENWKELLPRGLPDTILIFTNRYIHTHVKTNKQTTPNTNSVLISFSKGIYFQEISDFQVRKIKFYCIFLKLWLSTDFIRERVNEERNALQTSFRRKVLLLKCRNIFYYVANTGECFLKFLQALYLVLLNLPTDAVFLQSRSQPEGCCLGQSSTSQPKQTPRLVRMPFSLLFPKCGVTFFT